MIKTAASAIPFITTLEQAFENVSKEVGFKFMEWKNQGHVPEWQNGMNYAVSEKFDLVDLLAGASPRILKTQTSSGDPRIFAVDMLDHAAINRAFASIGAIDRLVLTAIDREYGLFGELESITSEQVEQSFDLRILTRRSVRSGNAEREAGLEIRLLI